MNQDHLIEELNEQLANFQSRVKALSPSASLRTTPRSVTNSKEKNFNPLTNSFLGIDNKR